MKPFLPVLTLVKNSRGCWILDTVKGCLLAHSRPGGCYGDCYAMKIAGRYGVDFSHPVKRDFEHDGQWSLFGFKDEGHTAQIVQAIAKIDMPFVRIGEMGDPSHDWEHTVSVCEAIAPAGKPVVIITKHIRELSDEQCERLGRLDVCVNTSVSAMDREVDREYRIGQYKRLRPFVKSVLRVVSCSFNLETEDGARMDRIQRELFLYEDTLDTVFRPSKDNPLVTAKTINVTETTFLKSKALASVRSPETYFGHCSTCKEMCGVNV